jgi:hypothetical protein
MNMRPEAPGDRAFERDVEPAGEGRISRSRRLTKVALGLIRDDPAMLALAALSTLLSFGGAGLVFWLGGYFDHPRHTTGHLGVVWLIAYYPLTLVGTFFAVAIATAAGEAMEGGRLTVREALAAAWRRRAQVALWALLATGVGVLIQEIASRLPAGGRLASWVLGAAWNLIALFAIPVLALEGCTATACVKRSSRLLKERWGEGVTGTVAINAGMVVATLPATLLIVAGVTLMRPQPGAGVAFLVAGLAWLMTVSAVAGAVRQVFGVALYRYATTRRASGGFSDTDLANPFTPKKRGLLRRG